MLPDLAAQFGAAEERAQAAASQLATELDSATKASKVRPPHSVFFPSRAASFPPLGSASLTPSRFYSVQDSLARLSADFQNYRNRTEREKVSAVPLRTSFALHDRASVRRRCARCAPRPGVHGSFGLPFRTASSVYS